MSFFCFNSRCTLLVLTALTSLTLANEPEAKKSDEAKKEPAAESRVVTKHEITLAGEKISYDAVAGTLPLTKPTGEPRASVFYIAYVKQGVSDPATRPITFCFNGGPGSSSVWLHLGAYGPQRVVLPGTGVDAPKPPFQLAPNEHSILDATDLVFIDPVSTGFSRAEKGEEAKQFHGYTEDIESVGEFIRRYVTREQRWSSPKYLSGESYGVLRASGLAAHLHDRYGLYVNGLILVSGLIDFGTLSDSPGHDLPAIVFLPAYTAVAHYHRKLPADLQADLRAATAAAEQFAYGRYATALLQGSALPEAEAAAVATELARLTGLPADLIRRERLRLDPTLFRTELLKAEGRVVGRFDARALAPATGPADDPSYANVYGAYAAALNDYVRRELNFTHDQPYEILTSAVRPWSYAPFTNRYVNVSSDLAEVLNNNPNLRLFVAAGWYDLATPYLGLPHSLRHVPAQTAPVIKMYDGGHMMYTNPAALAALGTDLRAFLRDASK